MRVMMLMIPKVYRTPGPAPPPSPELIAQMMRYNEELTKAGVLLALDGLYPPTSAARVLFGGARPRVVAGPFAEAREAVGGYWQLQVKSRDEAIEWAARCPAAEGDIIEVRQVHDLADFAPENLPPISPELSKIGAR